MRSLHRWTMTFALILLGYLAITGLLLQSSDVISLLTNNATEIDSIRDGSAGPPGYIGMNPPEAEATPLPAGSADAMLRKALSATPNLALSAIELRRLGTTSQAVITTAATPPQSITIDTDTGRIVASGPAAGPGIPGGSPSRHDSIKTWHRGNIIGTPGVALNVLTSLLLALLVITGVAMYLQMLFQRSKAGLSGFFWPSGDVWRRLHRLVAILASLFLLTMSVSGFLIGFDELMLSLSGGPRMMAPQAEAASPAIARAKLASALAETEQLAAATQPGQVLLSIKLRTDAGHLQGIIWTDGVIPQPALFDLAASREITSPSAGQPSNRPLGLPWKWHQIAKRIHRGDIIGLSGRAMDLLTGLSLLFLVISGGKMYLNLWLGRRQLRRSGLFW